MPKKSFNRILDEHLYILIAQGNNEAFHKLRKRYHRHALILTTELMHKYSNSGITRKELVIVCEDHFPFVISKYVAGYSSFYSFWKESTMHEVMNYIIENSYEGKAFTFRGAISLDQNSDEKHLYSDFLAEKDDDKALKRKIFEIKTVLAKYDIFFTFQEKAILNLVLEGYTLAELEHTGMLKKSRLYLTYKSAVDKLQSYMNEDEK